MLTRQELARLERSLRASRALSVYLDRRMQDPAARDAWRVALDNLIKDNRDALASASHDEREAFDRAVAQLMDALAAPGQGTGTPGWVGFFPQGGTAHVEALPVEMPTLVAWGDGIRIAPYIRALKQHVPAVVAIVDARAADLYMFAHGEVTRVDTLHARVGPRPDRHMGDPPRQRFHAGTRGAVGADAAEDSRRLNRAELVRSVVARLEVLAGASAWILVGGIPEAAAEVVRALPERLQQRADKLRGLDVHATPAEIRDAACYVVTGVSRRRDLELVLDLFDQEAAEGRAVTGEPGTREALHEHAVETLFFTGTYVATRPLEAEELVRLALDDAGEPQYVSAAAAARLDQAGGVGAHLRFVPARGQAPLTMLQHG